MKKLIDIRSYPAADVLDTLLQDKSTKKNIIWATDTYEELGGGFTDKAQISKASLMLRSDIIRPRIQKSLEAQAQRTRKKAEVFTPAWLCNRMNNHLDEDWFGRTGVFNTENEDHTWTVTEEKIEIPEGKTWQQYVDSRRLEITCGEAPYLVSRYDVSAGELIVPPKRRIGMLDRKLRLVNENTDSFDDWLKWVIRAFEACYGYEYQGDNVLIARINLLLTFVDYYEERWQKKPDPKFVKQITNIIVWNIWQMDGLKDTVPLGKPYEEYQQLSLFDMPASMDESTDKPEIVPCRIFNWRSRSSLKFMDVKELRNMGKKLFDYVIGNPPYQEQVSDADKNSSLSKQLFPIFIRESTTVADKVMLITPSRWFTGDAQDKSFLKLREFIRNNNHIKYLCNYPDAHEVFPNAEIKGGISYFIFDYSYVGKVQFDISQCGKIKTEIRNLFEDGLDVIISDGMTYSILSKVIYSKGFQTINEITRGRNAFGIIGKEDVLQSKSKKECFNGSIKLYCKAGEIRWTDLSEITKGTDIVDKYKVFISKSAGSPGKDLNIIGRPYVGERKSACTDSFFPIGSFETFHEADNLRKYIQTQFLRFMGSVMKISQNVTQLVYKFVPLQDFTKNSDIDWSKSIHEIDLQLYRKYGLDEKEIEFIETHVKEMA